MNKKNLSVDLKYNDFIVLNFNLFFSNQSINYYLGKNNINFRIKSLEVGDTVANSHNFNRSIVFQNLKFTNKTKNELKFSFKLCKKEFYEVKSITFGLCEEGICWNNDFNINFYLKNSFFNTKQVIVDSYLETLGRQPDDDGFSFFNKNIISGNIPIYNLKKILMDSEENLNKSNVTFFSRINYRDSLLRIPILFSYFGKNKFKSNIYGEKNTNVVADELSISKYISEITNKNISSKAVCFDFSMDFDLKNKNTSKYRYTMYEADDIAKEWVDKFKSENLKKIIVPDDWCKKIYSKYFDNISVVPLGTHYHDVIVKREFDVFTFGYIARFELRKNHKFLINAFKKKFSNNPNFKLKIHGPIGHNYNEILSLCEGITNIIVTSNSMTEVELDKWWSDINCYIMPSSGEGFSHTPREALMRGIPTIVSNYSAHEKLVNLGIVRSFSPADMEFAYKAVLFNRNVGMHAVFKEEDLLTQIDYVLNNYKDAINTSLIGRQYLLENESWEICAEKLMDVLNE